MLSFKSVKRYLIMHAFDTASSANHEVLLNILYHYSNKTYEKHLLTVLQLKLFYPMLRTIPPNCISLQAQMGRFSILHAHTHTHTHRALAWIHQHSSLCRNLYCEESEFELNEYVIWVCVLCLCKVLCCQPVCWKSLMNKIWLHFTCRGSLRQPPSITEDWSNTPF